MAAPPEKNVHDLNGKWRMNKSLCNDFDKVLQLQGIGWWIRRTIGLATITVTCKSYTEDGKEHLDVNQELTGGIQSTPEPRVFDWELRAHTDSVFGNLEGRTRFVDPKTLEEGYGKEDIEYLSTGWDTEGEQIQSWVRNIDSGWTGNQVWGFQVIDGVRRYVRKAVVTTKDGKKESALLAYDWLGPA